MMLITVSGFTMISQRGGGGVLWSSACFYLLPDAFFFLHVFTSVFFFQIQLVSH